MNNLMEWFARNSVAANLLMVLILGGGLITISRIRMEIFPEFSSDIVTVSVIYPGSSPEEVEEGICIRIEEAIQGLEGIKRITSSASENIGVVNVELLAGTDVRKLLEDVKSRVDAINTFPKEAEKPLSKEVIIRQQVINIAISGKTDEASLKTLGERVRDDISLLPGITQVELTNVRPYEVSIEISETVLQRYKLTFDEISQAVRRSSLDLPGGSIRTKDGEILLRTKGQAYWRPEFESLVIRTRSDGTHLKLGDIAQVIDGFAETDQSAKFDGQPTVLVQVFRVGNQNALNITEKVKAYILKSQKHLPENIQLTIWADFSRVLESRLNLMLRNGIAGFILVFISLTLFLQLRLAFWVALGIPISFMGAIWTMPAMNASINLISLFAFIVVLGIVVDDAIIVGENIYRNFQEGNTGVIGAITGTQGVSVPVIFAVLTSIAAFFPLLTVQGRIGKIMAIIPEIVIVALLFSLIESLLILPAHLGNAKITFEDKTSKNLAKWTQFQNRFTQGLQTLNFKIYRPLLELALEWRYFTLAFGFSTLLITIGLIGGGLIKFSFFPKIDADNVVAWLTMPQGTPVEVTRQALHRLEKTAEQLRLELEAKTSKKIFRHILVSLGEQPLRTSQSNATPSFSNAHLGEVNVELEPSEIRGISSFKIAKRWRELTSPIPDVQELSFASSLFSAGEAINVQFSGPNYHELQQVTEKFKDRLKEYSGIIDISDSFQIGKQEAKLSLTRAAETFGITLSDLARQVRQAFYGEEAQRIQRGRNEVKVMIRYPLEERRSLDNLENMRIRTPEGGEVPFRIAANFELGRGYATIKRANQKRIVNVTADINESKATSKKILHGLTTFTLPQILADHPNVRYTFEGEQREQRETLDGLQRSFAIALLVIYFLLAIPFKSYLQPLIVMAAIPFGAIGATWGHLIMGINLTILSLFGVVALTGVVVNDSLVMVNFINRSRSSGQILTKAIREAGVARFRPILLTSLTTFLGLSPLLLEKSLQAQFLIPMAVSLGFGIIFATFITLILVPVSYLILEDLKRLWVGFFGP